MDILNWLHLKKQKFIKSTFNNTQTDLLIIGADVGFNERDDKYQSYAMTIDDFIAQLPTSGIVLTTVGASGPATLIGNTLNIPDYTTSGGLGTVTSVGITLGTSGNDVNVLNTPITSSGDIALNIPIASATNTGKLSSTDWTIFNGKQNALGYTPANKAGDTFTGPISATNLSGTNTGDETQSTIKTKLGAASASQDGYLTLTDWSAFDSKQDSITLTTLGTTGPATFSANILNIPDYSTNAGIADVIQQDVKLGESIATGQAVYVFTADGTNVIVKKASNTSEATSSKTIGLLLQGGALNFQTQVVTEGRLGGLDTSTATLGDSVWLGVNGDLIYGLANKPYAPAHLVYLGVVTRVNVNNGEIYVHVQNGFELDEIHDVDLKTTLPVANDILGYNGSLWLNKSISGWLGYTPENVANKSTNTSLGTSDTLYPTQNAVKVYADNLLGSANALVYKGVIDCSTNPNYPAADAGWMYIVSVAGKIGSASGVDVEVGDMLICNTDGSPSGNQTTVGANWNVIQKNIIGAVTGPASSVNNRIAVFDSVTGKIIKQGVLLDDGSTVSIGEALDFTAKFNVFATDFVQFAGKFEVFADNGTGGGLPYPVYGIDSIASNLNETAIGGRFIATDGNFNYSLRLIDGTETVAGRFLKNMNTSGDANWVTLTVADTGLTVTTTGTSGPATLVGNILNIPQYSGGANSVCFSPMPISVCDTAPTAATTQYYYQTVSEVSGTISKAKIWGYSGSDTVLVGIYRGTLQGTMTLIGQGSATCGLGPNVINLTAESGQNLTLTAGEDLVVGYYPTGTSFRTIYDVGISDIYFGISNTADITTMPTSPTGTASAIRFALTLYS